VVVLLPDSGSRYLSKVFDDNWMRENRFLESEWVDMRVSAVLERKARQELVVASFDEKVGDVIAKMKAHDFSQLPVVGERDQLLGLVTEVGLLNHLLQQPGGEASQATIEAAGAIDTSVYTLTPETPVEAVMSVFSTHPIALVVERAPNSDDRRREPHQD
jgi:cystathionine beta-synthase